MLVLKTVLVRSCSICLVLLYCYDFWENATYMIYPLKGGELLVPRWYINRSFGVKTSLRKYENNNLT